MNNIHKVINSLPATLEPNSTYLVRNGVGFDVYVTTVAGVPIRQNDKWVLSYGARVILLTDTNITYNINYGPHSERDWARNIGGPLGMEPGGFEKGKTIGRNGKLTNIGLQYRCNNTQEITTDVRLWRQTKSYNANADATNTLIWQAELTTSDTVPRRLDLTTADFGDVELTTQDELFFVWRRVSSVGNTGNTRRYFVGIDLVIDSGGT